MWNRNPIKVAGQLLQSPSIRGPRMASNNYIWFKCGQLLN